MGSDPYFNKFLMMPGKLWDVYISEEGGNNLGRLFIWLKRDGIVDYDDLTDSERTELLEMHRIFKPALKKLFQPDGPLNFAYLANNESHEHHCHWHMVPRYKAPRVFMGQRFVDVAWGKQWKSDKMHAQLAIAVGEAIMRAVRGPED